MLYEITYSVPNFNNATVEVWEWKSNFTSQLIVHVITYANWDYSETMVVKRAPDRYGVIDVCASIPGEVAL